MSEKYNLTCERLWELLEQTRHEWDVLCVNLKEPFPMDQFELGNPRFRELRHQVRDEFDYDMSEAQCSWAVVSFMRDNLTEYRNRNGLLPLTPSPKQETRE